MITTFTPHRVDELLNAHRQGLDCYYTVSGERTRGRGTLITDDTTLNWKNMSSQLPCGLFILSYIEGEPQEEEDDFNIWERPVEGKNRAYDPSELVGMVSFSPATQEWVWMICQNKEGLPKVRWGSNCGSSYIAATAMHANMEELTNPF